MKKTLFSLMLVILIALASCGADLMASPGANPTGYWKRYGEAEVISKWASPAQYGHEYNIVAMGGNYVRFDHRDGLSGTRTKLFFEWSAPEIIVPDEVPPVSLKYDYNGAAPGGFSARFDLPGGTTDGGIDLLRVDLISTSPPSGRAINTKFKAPLQTGDRAMHYYAGLTGGLSYQVRVLYRWIEGDPPPEQMTVPPAEEAKEIPAATDKKTTAPVRLDSAPGYKKYVKPVYPAAALSERVEGVIILEAQIDAQGNVTDVQVLRGKPLLTEAAIDSVKQCKYEPYLLEGKPHPAVFTVIVPFTFK